MPSTTHFRGDGQSRTFRLAEALSSSESVVSATVSGQPVTVESVEGVAVIFAEAPEDGSTVSIRHLSAAIDGRY